MSAHLTPKENYLRCLDGDIPEYIPAASFGPMPGATEPVPNILFTPTYLAGHRFADVKDIWGVTWVGNDEAMGGRLPEPGNFILDDITRWRDVIKAPDISGIDWEGMIKKQLDQYESMHCTRETTAISLDLHFGFFMDLVSFMGFENGMIAMFEEPEEVHALLDYLCTFFESVADKVVPILNPDIIALADDVCSWRAPFVSEEMWRELILPYHDRIAKYGRDRGLHIAMHCCGEAMELIQSWKDIGVDHWNPAQTSNDLDAVKAKYGNSMVIQGGFDGRGRLLEPDVTEEELRNAVRDTINRLAPGGGYCWSGMIMGLRGDERTAWKNGIIQDEAKKLCADFYK
jgi:hypothetical protein